MPRYNSEQLAAAAAAGSPLPSASFDTDQEWHEYQQRWLSSFWPEQRLPSPRNLQRRVTWKAARRRYKKITRQLGVGSSVAVVATAADDDTTANNATATDATAIDTATAAAVATAIDTTADNTTATDATATDTATAAAVPPQITRDNAHEYPPPVLSEYAMDARGPGSAPAVWYKQMGSVINMTSKRHTLMRRFRRSSWAGDNFWSSSVCWQKAVNEWLQLVADEALRKEALRARPRPHEQLVPPVLPHITKANAAQYPPPSLTRFHKDDCGLASAPAVWYKQMAYVDWHVGVDLDDMGCPDRAQLSALYETQRRRWHRMLPDAQEKERQREKTRKRERGEKNPMRRGGGGWGDPLSDLFYSV
jgi:hypothetical protein